MGKIISVIVPVYNVEKYVKRCLDSILKQTYKDLEIIVVDDGSSDNSLNICKCYEKKHRNVFVYHKENGGLSSARNYGMSKASGQYFAFIDSDDAIHENFFKYMMSIQQKYNADIVSSDMYLFVNESELLELKINNRNHEIRVLSGDEILGEYYAPKTRKMYIYHGLCMKIYRKELFDNLYFEEGRLHEDLYITYILLNKAKVFCYYNLPLYYYFQGNDSSICKNFKNKNFVDEYDAFDNIKSFESNRSKQNLRYIHFLIIRYIDLLYEGRYLNDQDIKIKKNCIRSWVRRNIWFDRELGALKKILIFILVSSDYLIGAYKNFINSKLSTSQ